MVKQVRLREAISIGIGGMVGGGIFAVLGLAVSLAGGGTPAAFLFSGIIALITSYSYTKLSLSYPDKGGTVKFINQGFGITVFSGGINNLLWVSYIVMLSLYATAFGSYATNLFHIVNKQTDFHIYTSGIVTIATIINYYSIKVVGKIESYVVVTKVIILLAFVVIGLYGLYVNPDVAQLSVSNWESPLKLFTGGMVIFVAYEGFELIANAAPDIENPQRNIPKAYYYSVIFVILLYIVIAFVTVGSLSFSTIEKAKDYVLAEAAKPMLGHAGFIIITIAALLSTFSAINATLLGGSRVSYEMGEDNELPHHLTSMLWNQPLGLFITTMNTLLIANALKLESISTAGSAGFLLIFGAVNFTSFKLSKQINGNKAISMSGCILCVTAFIVLILQQYSTNKIGVLVSISIIFICFIAEWIFKKVSRPG